MSNATLARMVLLAALAFAASPLIFPGFAGYDAGRFPIPQVDPPVQPEGWAFSIWGIIYLWLILGAGFGLWRRKDDPDWRAMRPPLLASLAVGSVWLPVAQHLPGLATLMILAMLGGAILALLRAGRRDPGWQAGPVALYAGWLTAASGVSAGIWLGGHGWLSPIAAAILALLAVSALALAVQTRRPGAWPYPAAVIWALLGIVIANLQAGPGGRWPVIATAALAAAVLFCRIWTNRPAADDRMARRTDRPGKDRP
ncbi:tryptophan-rich sensory protein [Paracoccus gahaiensis]|uniref:Tryptophan-rich sensory protein n=1 Tax=Paracoccus gahaiensis TaxID=1706839 RepID=A0A4U0RDJ4_9RHOB|nr:tryptophan-rich sensory protein [Paracoccus gahaiensis]TJZ93315.1 tryptophan-rich sensory protein [Paracoccus gahaiensis]